MLNLPKIEEYMLDNRIPLHTEWYIHATSKKIVPRLDDSLVTPNLTDQHIMALWGNWSERIGRKMDKWQGYLSNDHDSDFREFRRYLHNAWRR